MNRKPKDTSFKKIESNGIVIAYESFGRISDQAVLLIAGLGNLMVIWDEAFCMQIASRGYRVIRFDNRDSGLSESCEECGLPDIMSLLHEKEKGKKLKVPYKLVDMAEDAVGLLDALGIKSAHVVGASMGGMIGQLMAIHYPERLFTLNSIMSTSGDPSLPPPRDDAMSTLFEPLPKDRKGYVDAWINIWRILSGPVFPVDEALSIRWAEESYRRGPNPSGFTRQFAAVIESGSRKDQLKGVRVPSLIIHGDLDPLVPLECGIDTAKSIPGSKMLIIDGMGHALPESLWSRVIDAIISNVLQI